MKTIDMQDAGQSLADSARQARVEPVVVTENGQPVAVVMAIDNADLETVSLSTNARFLALVERSRASVNEQGSLSAEEVRRQLGLM